ncbi:MAG: sensor domain-containing diguanylate cyclase [Sulfuricaulis sp.]|uniref:sensor domain-containing diguanylate cyclase n=1 Tax=Sulfuricaulis sp. TaxID=2003553 RepID=UPI0025D2A1BE|nr:diguanylate cyclase [Sulfuricaulis sp.]MCR4347621.1 sensor domain-containing diguanylate cyclase [Sulfuricaulis sp.]
MAQSLTRIHLQVFLILLLCFSAIGYAGYLALRDMQWSSYRERVLQTSQETAARINRLLTQQRQALEKTTRLPAVVMALQRGSSVARSHKEDEIESQLPGVVSVQLMSHNNSGGLSSAEALDPACLDYVQRMAKTNTPAVPEFHATGTPAAHYDLAAPIMNENRSLAGYLLARFSSAPLQAILDQSLPPHAYMELQQPVSGAETQAVLTAGEPSDTVTVSSELGNSHWTLIYQPAETPSLILSGSRKIYFAIILSAFVIITIVLFRLYRKTLKAVRHDIHSLVRMFRDLREGSVRVEYPMALREFAEIFDYLRDRGQKLVKEKEKLRDMGLMDHLSQLGNRRHFETRLQELFDASKASGLSSVLMIDMDHFKAVNDKHGHDAGDALIVGFANALRKVVRQTDVLARLGGDEFCIIYSYAPLEKATVLVERLRKQLPREILLTKGVMHQLRWTGGLSAMSDKDTKPDDVLWRADQALLQAKEAGRNVTKVSDPVAGLPAKKKIIVG